MSPKGRADILFLVAAQMREAKAVAKQDGLHKQTARARVHAHLARMPAFDFPPGVKEWRRACVAQLLDARPAGGSLGRATGPFGSIERDLGPAIVAVRAFYPLTYLRRLSGSTQQRRKPEFLHLYEVTFCFA